MKARLKTWLTTRVWCGPWTGMRYLDAAHGSSLLPKVVGTYELELQPDAVQRIRAARRRVLDLGAAEGYYAVGSLLLNRSIHAVAYESSPEARAACLELAERNQVAHRLTLKGHCGLPELEAELAAHDVDLLVVDIEGGEQELLDPARLPALGSIPILVELHDVFFPGLKQVLRQRFEATHTVREIHARDRSVRDIRAPWLRWAASLSPMLADRLLNERRPPGMSWYVLDPRENPAVPNPPTPGV